MPDKKRRRIALKEERRAEGERLWAENRSWYWPAEAAKILCVSDSTLYRMTATGEITAEKVGKSKRFTRAELLRVCGKLLAMITADAAMQAINERAEGPVRLTL